MKIHLLVRRFSLRAFLDLFVSGSCAEFLEQHVERAPAWPAMALLISLFRVSVRLYFCACCLLWSTIRPIVFVGGCTQMQGHASIGNRFQNIGSVLMSTFGRPYQPRGPLLNVCSWATSSPCGSLPRSIFLSLERAYNLSSFACSPS